MGAKRSGVFPARFNEMVLIPANDGAITSSATSCMKDVSSSICLASSSQIVRAVVSAVYFTDIIRAR